MLELDINGLKLMVMAGIVTMLSACGGSDGTTANANLGGTGRVTLGITDSPVDMAEKVVVRFTGVEILPGEGNSSRAQTITFAEPKTLDLLALQGGLRDTLLNGQELPAGQYGQIRLIVQAEHDTVMDSYITINGAQHELRVPSGNQTGLKLVHSFSVESGATKDYTIDFDLRKSVVFARGQGYMLKPVLRLVETASAGIISGTVNPSVFTGQTCTADPLVGYAVYVYTGIGVMADDLGSPTVPLATASVTLNDTAQYVYTAGFIAPGQYTLAATCHADLDDTEANDDDVVFMAPVNVTITSGATTTHNFQ